MKKLLIFLLLACSMAAQAQSRLSYGSRLDLQRSTASGDMWAIYTFNERLYDFFAKDPSPAPGAVESDSVIIRESDSAVFKRLGPGNITALSFSALWPLYYNSGAQQFSLNMDSLYVRTDGRYFRLSSGNANITGSYRIGGNTIVDRSTNYSRLLTSNGVAAISAGNASDPTTKYNNDTHIFANAVGTEMARFASNRLLVGYASSVGSQYGAQVNSGGYFNGPLLAKYMLADSAKIDSLYLKGGRMGFGARPSPYHWVKIGPTNVTDTPAALTNILLGNSGSLGSGIEFHGYSNGQTGVIQNFMGDFTFLIPGSHYFNAGGNVRMMVKSDGKIGINTVSPSYGLDVASTARTTLSTYLATASGKVGIRRTSPTYVLDVAGTARADSSTYLATVSGSVGIGTTSPGQKLEITSASPVGIRLNYSAANTWDIINNTSGVLDFVRGGSNTHMRIDQFGNVGMGTTSPHASAALDVTSTTGFLIPPRMTGTQRDTATAATSPPDGAILYNTTTSKLQIRAGGAWVDLH